MNIYDAIKNGPRPKQNIVEQLQFVPGIWVNGQYFWMNSSMEKVIYEEELVVKVKQEQIHSKIRFSNIYVSNHSNREKEIKILVMHQYPNPSHEQLTFISPLDNRIFHLANKNVYMVNGQYEGKGLKEYTTMAQWNVFTDQIWNSLRKGTLKYQPMAKGLAASIFTIKMTIGPHQTNKVNTWAISGNNKSEVISLEQALLKNTLAFRFEK
jgi:hypothetical protein